MTLPTTGPYNISFLQRAIAAAAETYERDGNYPVGAALAIDDRLLDVVGNQIKRQRSYLMHAEMQLIVEHAPALYEAYQAGGAITLYTTLEPCLQCLGAAFINRVGTIVYVQPDPNGGATGLDRSSIGTAYTDRWPTIIHAPISDEPLRLMRRFLHDEIAAGNTDWPLRMLGLLETED